MRAAFRFICTSMIIGLLYLIGIPLVQAEQDTNGGTIMAVDVHERTIQINQKIFSLADSLQVFAPSGLRINQLMLAPGQKIQYSTSTQQQEASASTSLNTAITTIHIISGYKENVIKQ
ncbi:MAG: hypothetical protein BGO43_10395 [Gammaproteobacteria bacterium 39-13]|nr:hypothetical protein [Gammaproteobacteria bacterium]OJV90334.1 MAG: hypothetical protein BGO43_10395 [Gammaproteobacteria bacterium 39-13]